VDPAAHRRVLEAFADAAGRGDLRALRELMAEDAELVSDGGGKVASFGRILRGAQRLAQLYFAVFRRLGARADYRLVRIDGRPGLARFVDGELESVQAFEFDARGRIAAIYAQRNPDKLRRARRRLSQTG
jgi:RNA polymerase sigma-70 factor, ECF subfamily